MYQSFLQNTLIPNSTSMQFHNEDIYPVGLDWFLKSLMLLVTLLGIIGNGLVCYFFVKKKIRQSSFNMLLLNLSIADLLQDIFAYPTFFVGLTMLRGYSQKAANVLCSFTVSPSSVGALLSVSNLTITYISLNRFVSIRFPLRNAWFKSRKATFFVVLAIWVLSIGFIVPSFFSMRYDASFAVCHREWPKGINDALWSTSILIVGLIVPVTTMLLTFFSTVRKFKTMMLAPSQQGIMMKKKRAVKLLGFLMLAFFICWGPYCIYLQLSLRFKSLWPAGPKGHYLKIRIMRCVFLLLLTNTVADPLLYGYCNLQFRKNFKEIFTYLRLRRGYKSSTAQVITVPSLELQERAEEPKGHYNDKNF